ncbi:hypothetical protein AcV5_010157 [Taiwanofungus camphoratus]|nr:hypothetical protein AcV5_010157 [Antrodia cinnamomea]
MATAFAQPASALQSPRQHYLHPNPSPQRRHTSRQRFCAEFSQCLYDFVIQLLPTTEEMAVKEDVRKLLERLIRTIEPDSRLLSFGSSANGFNLRNSGMDALCIADDVCLTIAADMDLCCLIDSEERLSATDLVTMLGDLLERETRFHVKPLPHARIPIVKLTLDPSLRLPFGIACDIGFENRLALENTRLLRCYAMIDPARVQTMVLFLKVWSKRRKINSPYKGTLSSYGYVLLVIYFLVHVKNPPVLPNLQQMPPMRPISHEDTHLNGFNIWFFDDIELLRQRWKSSNTESVAELLIDFFKFYSRDFTYNSGVASIRAGLLKKESKGWHQSEYEKGSMRERNRLCVEVRYIDQVSTTELLTLLKDPFETDFNVARCVTKDGLYTIRGEFMRASRILASRPERAIVALAQLCEERQEDELPYPNSSRTGFMPPRLSPLPPQIPYTVGSSPMRPNRVSVSAPDSDAHAPSESQSASTYSPQATATTSSPTTGPETPGEVPIRLPLDQLEHMAPKRGKWTSPPPPEAPEEDRSAFEDRLGQSLALATVAISARQREQRERETADASSSNASEVHTDDEVRSDIAESDEAHSVRSYAEEGVVYRHRDRDREATVRAMELPTISTISIQHPPDAAVSGPSSRLEGGVDTKMIAKLRGRPAARLAKQMSEMSSATITGEGNDAFAPPPRIDTPRRSLSGPARTSVPYRFPQLVIPHFVPNPAYIRPPDFASPQHPAPYIPTNANIFYETTPAKDRMFRVMGQYQLHVSPVSQFQQYDPSLETSGSPGHPSSSSPPQLSSPPRLPAPPRQHSPRHLAPSLRRSSKLAEAVAGPSQLESQQNVLSPIFQHYSHSHSHSAATITSAPTPRAHVEHSGFGASLSPSLSRSRSPPHPLPHSRPHSRQQIPPRLAAERSTRPISPFASLSSGSTSPPMSCSSSHYAPSVSPLSTSPPSPTHSELGKHTHALVHIDGGYQKQKAADSNGNGAGSGSALRSEQVQLEIPNSLSSDDTCGSSVGPNTAAVSDEAGSRGSPRRSLR